MESVLLQGSPTYLNGEIDEFRIWNEERSSGDIQTYMSTHLNPASFSTLAVNFDFNELLMQMDGKIVQQVLSHQTEPQHLR